MIPKHQVKHAVSRNRIRRVVREGFRHHAVILLAWDIVISIRARAEEISIKTTEEGLRAQIDAFFTKLSADKA